MAEYEPDEDGLPREIVGSWVTEKHAKLAAYVDISREFARNGLAKAKRARLS